MTKLRANRDPLHMFDGRRGPRMVRAVFACLLFSSGCAHSYSCPDRYYDAGIPLVSQAEWSSIERGAFPSIASSIAQYDQAVSDVPSRLTNVEYRELQRIEAQCRAAEYAPLAHLLLSESDATAANEMCDPDGDCSAPLKRDLLEIRAIDERNKAARNALQAYYRLAEAEAGLEGLDRSLPIIDRALEDARRIREQGITLPQDESALIRQRYQLLDQREDAQLAALQLNEQLARLLGIQQPQTVRFWPQVDWGLQFQPLNEDTLIAVGMSERADLALLRRMQDDLNASTVSAARQVLGMVNGGLGQTSPMAFLFGHKKRCACAACEVPVRRQQLAQLTAQQEETAAGEIRQAVYAVETRLRQTALAADTLKSWRERLEQIRILRRNDKATSFEVYSAELAVISAETDLYRQIIAVRLAEVDLEGAQGILAADCGYSVRDL